MFVTRRARGGGGAGGPHRRPCGHSCRRCVTIPPAWGRPSSARARAAIRGLHGTAGRILRLDYARV